MAKQFAVILSGCGVYDGAEIHESVLSLLAIHRHGAGYQCFAPDIAQHHVINHLSGEESGESRNVLVESARIARGAVKPLTEYDPADYDALFLPGGFGAAKNLSTIAFDGPDAEVDASVSNAIRATHAAEKPIGALCISPAVVARVLGDVTVTIGREAGTIGAIEAMGAKHRTTTHGEIVVDSANRIVTSPCYMLDANIGQIADGADAAVKAVLDLCG